MSLIKASEGKIFRRIADGTVYGNELYLGYTYIIGGVILDEPHLDTPEDFEEINTIAENVGGFKERPTASIVVPSGTIVGYTGYEDKFPLLAWEEILPVGTEIKTIKIKHNDSWVDIHELNILDCIPYVLNMSRVYVDELDSGGYVFALLGRVGYWGVLVEEYISGATFDVEIIYYTDGGVE